MRSLFFSLAALCIAACNHSSQPTKNAELSSRPVHRFTSDAAGFDTNSFWFDTGKEVVVFDAQFTNELAAKVIEQIQSKTQSPIKYVVVTHPNPDKFNGVSAFQALGAKVVASEATTKAIPEVHAYKKYFFVNIAKMFTDESYPQQAKVDITFSKELSLSLEASGKITLRELKHSGVSSTQTVAYIAESRALIVGDLVHYKTHAWLEGGIINGKPSPSLQDWKMALDELLSYEGAMVYGGRGEAAPVADVVREEKAYLDTMNQIVTQYVSSLGTKRSELSSNSAGEHYKKISQLAQDALPGYALPYMIDYGVYGLVNQIATK
jgi:glyoxylase-like metal-dependent hydrolase (beta-lactamase superfamily II)